MSDDILSDDEINAILLKEKKKARIGVLVMIIGIILVVGLYIYWETSDLHDAKNLTLGQEILLYSCVGIGILGYFIRFYAMWSAKKHGASHIVRTALKEVFDEVENYSPMDCLSSKVIEQSKMKFPFSYDYVKGSDFVQATYKGIGVVISDIILTSGSGKNEKKVFEGLWMICDFKKKLSTELRLTERTKLTQTFSKGSVQTDSASFNKQFVINTDSPHEAFYILTPHMMEFIQDMDQKAYGDTCMSFMREGQVHIAINSGRNAFEIDSLKNDADKLRKRFVRDLKYTTNLIDALNLVDTLFEEDVKNKNSA